MDYEELDKGIKEAPVTWLPALLITAVEESIKKGVWASPDKLHTVMDKVIARMEEDNA